MTTVEFLYRSPTENIVSALALRPQKIIFIGNKADTREDIYKHFIKEKSPSTKTDFIYTDTADLSELTNTLNDIVKTENEVTFDVTGGEDLLLVAMGIVAERYKQSENVSVIRFDIDNNRLLKWKNGEKTETAVNAFITTDDQIALHGGLILENRNDEICINDETAKIIDGLWSVFKKDPHYNENIKLLQRAIKKDTDTRELSVRVDIANFKAMENDPNALIYLIDFLQLLKDDSIINFLKITNSEICFTFINVAAKELLGKAGNILEMQVLKTAQMIKNQNGSPYYSDCRRSVMIDWDGKVGSNKTGDTKNEIDCILMKNLVPVFISCKGGEIEEVELYKLDAVSRRFGGKYAKRVLISTDHGKDGASAAHFRKRAEDMNITLLENVHLLNENEFIKMMKDLV